DNCGFGLIAHMHGEASHALLRNAIEALTCMTHRGGIAADGKTGDGCGLLLKKPDSFLRAIVAESLHKSLSRLYGVGMVFLNPDEALAARSRAALDSALIEQGLQPVGWRVVPTCPDVLGPIALEGMPRIEQVFVNCRELTARQLETRLFIARRTAEKALAADPAFYVCSLSERVLSYKGLT